MKMKRKVPIWSLFILLLFLFTFGTITFLAAQRNNMKIGFTTLAGDSNTLTPIQLSATLVDSNTVEDSWEVTFDFKNSVITKTFHDGVYAKSNQGSSLDLELRSYVDDYYFAKGTGKYYVKDDYSTLPLELTTSDNKLPVIKNGENYPYLEVIPSNDWYVEVENYNGSGTSSSNVGFNYIELDYVMVNGRLFYTMDLNNYMNKANSLIEKDSSEHVIFSGTTGIFEIDLSYKPSETVTYEELIRNPYKISITNESQLKIVDLIGLEEQNAICLITLNNGIDLRFTIYQLDSNEIVFDEVIYSFPESIRSDYPFECFYHNGVFTLNTINPIQLVSDEEVAKLYDAAVTYDTEYEESTKEDYENIYSEPADTYYNNSYWDAYYAAFMDEQLFIIVDINSSLNCSFINKFSSLELDTSGHNLALTEMTDINDMLYVNDTLYILYSNHTSYDYSDYSELALMVVQNNCLSYLGKIESDVLEDYTIASQSDESDFNYSIREIRDYKLSIQPY